MTPNVLWEIGYFLIKVVIYGVTAPLVAMSFLMSYDPPQDIIENRFPDRKRWIWKGLRLISRIYVLGGALWIIIDFVLIIIQILN